MENKTGNKILAKPISGTKNGKEWKGLAVEATYANILYKGVLFPPRDNGPIKPEESVF